MRIRLDTEIRSHELWLPIKHVINFHPSSLAELETSQAQPLQAQGSCHAGQVWGAGAVSFARLRQRLCEGKWGQEPEKYPVWLSVPSWSYCRRYLTASSATEDLHVFLQGTGEVCSCAPPRGRWLLWAAPRWLLDWCRPLQNQGNWSWSLVWRQEAFPFRPDQVVVILSHFCCAGNCSLSLSMPFLPPSNKC